jgi:sodium-dependent dicarboxylate transporter 2/3/5
MSFIYCDRLDDFLTEFLTATTEMMLPIVAGLTNQIQINPLFIMIPVTAASMAFMFPIATPPNAVVLVRVN